MKLIYVCSPCRGVPPFSFIKTAWNIRKARMYCAAVLAAGHIPIAPHYFYRGLLSDTRPDQRAKALNTASWLLHACDEVWVFGSIISEGMLMEIRLAEGLRLPIS